MICKLEIRVRPVVNASAACDHLFVAVSVLIVDDHPAFRASARAMLELEGFEVVGEAEDGTSGIEQAGALEPDVVLLDVALPDMSGFDVAERLAPGTKVVLTSSRHRSDFGRRVRSSRALGFIPKDDLSGDALRRLMETP
jgi:DNA-binding NarL/FixJ family response regulator